MVGNDFSKIAELDKVRRQKKQIQERETELSVPRLTDLKMISQIHTWFEEICRKQYFVSMYDSVWFKKQFVFIILFLYSPATLVGGLATRGLRETLAGVMGFKSCSAVSNLYSELILWYSNYQNFRESTDFIYKVIAARLENQINAE